MCSLMWFRKKRPTPHFKVLCGGASRSSSSEESSERDQGSDARSLERIWSISDSGGILSAKKAQKPIWNMQTQLFSLWWSNFPTQVNLYCEDMPEAADSKSSPELETHSARRRAFLGTKNRFSSRSFCSVTFISSAFFFHLPFSSSVWHRQKQRHKSRDMKTDFSSVWLFC